MTQEFLLVDIVSNNLLPISENYLDFFSKKIIQLTFEPMLGKTIPVSKVHYSKIIKDTSCNISYSEIQIFATKKRGGMLRSTKLFKHPKA